MTFMIEMGRLLLLCAISLMLQAPVAGFASGDEFRQERLALVEIIQADVRRTSRQLDKELLDERVLDAMREVPRHLFVPKGSQGDAYKNRPLAIGHGQTISQPYIVAIMTDLLKPEKSHRVLEVGTGSGYQAAVMAALTGEVFTMEIIEPLAVQARQQLQQLGYHNVQVRIGDGYYGWEERAPFDAIIVTAAANHVPPPLVKQLKPGGRMIIPVGSAFMVQQLVLIEKNPAGEVTLKQILPVRFVPLTGPQGD
jgi:protein-L-isoaspartate(D-aspartate) O-methyltransferase